LQHSKCGFGEVGWVEIKANEEVLVMVDEKRELLEKIIRTKERWI